jgi:hypothetical protein
MVSFIFVTQEYMIAWKHATTIFVGWLLATFRDPIWRRLVLGRARLQLRLCL